MYIYYCILYIHKHIQVHILLYTMGHVHEKDKVWKQSRNWLFCSGFKVSKYLSGHHRCLSHSARSRRFFPTFIFLYFHYHRTHTHTYIHMHFYCSLITHMSDMINRIVCCREVKFIKTHTIPHHRRAPFSYARRRRYVLYGSRSI